MKGTFFSATILGNAVNETMVTGLSSKAQTPYAIFKIAVNCTAESTQFVNVICWGEHNVEYLKKNYSKGMRLFVQASCSQQFVKDEAGKIVKEIFYFNSREMINLSAKSKAVVTGEEATAEEVAEVVAANEMAEATA